MTYRYSQLVGIRDYAKETKDRVSSPWAHISTRGGGYQSMTLKKKTEPDREFSIVPFSRKASRAAFYVGLGGYISSMLVEMFLHIQRPDWAVGVFAVMIAFGAVGIAVSGAEF